MTHLSATPLAQYVLGPWSQMKRQKVKTVCGKVVCMERITCRPGRTDCDKCQAKLRERFAHIPSLTNEQVEHLYREVFGRGNV